jgi:hypothetical protein
MANDNTLGAPTEGLGQTVTFTARGGSTPTTSAMQRGRLQTAASGSNATSSSQAIAIPEAKQDPTFMALAKLGGDILKPHIEAERNASYMRGVQQAAKQQAITEIVDEQPWYSKLFGSTSLVDGARAYAASSVVTSMAVKLETSMDDIRKMSDGEFAKHTAAMLEQAKTGDEASDMLITQQFFSTMPSMMKAQAKAHVQYKTEVLGNRIGDNQDAAGSLLMAVDTSVREGKSREGPDLIEAALKVQESLTKPNEMSQEHFDKITTDRLVSQISNGNFALADLTEEHVKRLPAQSQYMIQRARNQATLEARGKLPVDFWEKRAAFLSMSSETGMTPERIVEARAELQSYYEKITGDKQSFISGNELTQEFMQRQAHQQRIEEAARRESAKGLATDAKVYEHQAEVNKHLLRITNPTPGSEEYISQLPDKMQQEVLGALAKTMPMSLRVQVLAVQSRAGVYDESLKQELAIAINGARDTNDPERLASAYAIYDSIIQNTGDRNSTVAQAYLSPENGRIMARYANIAKGGTPSPANLGVWHSYAVLPGGEKLEAKQDAALVDSVKTGRFMRALYAAGRSLGGDDYPVEDYEQLASLLKKRENKDILDADDRAASALAKATDLTVVGGHFWERSSKTTDIKHYFAKRTPEVGGIASDNVNKATRQYFNKLVDELRVDGKFKIVQLPDSAGGVPQLAMVGLDSSDKQLVFPFSADDIATSFKANIVRLKTNAGKSGVGLAPIATELDGLTGLGGLSPSDRALQDKVKQRK